MEKILKYKFDHKHKIIYVTIRGEITLNDFINHKKAKLSDPEHDDSYSVLADIRGSIFLISKEEKEIVYNMLKDNGNISNRHTHSL